jgi:nicotinamide mononucleotide (NMN) deamidase PncC
MAIERIAEWALARRVLRHLWTIDEDMGKVARADRERTIEHVLAIFPGRGAAGDTTENSPGTKWVAFNAIAEHLDYRRRYTSRTNQVQRSFEDAALRQRALELMLMA